MLRRSLALLLLVSSAIVPATRAKQISQSKTLAITHVTVIDVAAKDTKRVLKRDQTVVITGNRIAAFGETKRVKLPAGAQVIDATGKFLIPGLWDMHVHTLSKDMWETFFPLFIANGVTGVRDMGTSTPLEQVKQIRREIADGARIGPRIVAAGRIVDGPKPIIPPVSTGVANEAEARQIVRLLKQQGADFIKVYSLLPREAYFAVADEAKKQGLSFAGHVPLSVTAAEASRAGQKSMEHMFSVLEGCAVNEDELRQQAMRSAPAGLLRSQAESTDTFDPKKAAQLYSLLAKNHTWQVPTLAVRHSAAYYDEGIFANDPRLKFVYFSLRERWKPAPASPFSRLTKEDYGKLKRLFPAELKVIGEMRRAGVLFLAGTDTPNPYVFPGFSLHDELGWFVKAGLSPLQALQTATLNPATYLGMTGSLGTIEKGNLADLVLLDANPLEDIGNTKRISAVVANGRLFDRKALDAMLAQVESAADRK